MEVPLVPVSRKDVRFCCFNFLELVFEGTGKWGIFS